MLGRPVARPLVTSSKVAAGASPPNPGHAVDGGLRRLIGAQTGGVGAAPSERGGVHDRAAPCALTGRAARAFATARAASGSVRLDRMGAGNTARWLTVLVGALGTGLAWCASASASMETVEFGLAPSVATLGSTSAVSAYLAVPAYGGELISVSSLTPTVCTLPETPPARSISTEVHAIALGVCTLRAQSETPEAGPLETQHSFNVVVARTPTVTWTVRGKETVGAKGTVELASPARAGSKLTSTTPTVCKLTPATNNKLPPEITVADLRLAAPGTCTIVANVNAGGEYNSAQAQKSFKVHPRKRHRR